MYIIIINLIDYTQETDKFYKGMHHLSGVFILEENFLNIEDKVLKGFSICFTNKTRKYYCESLDIYNKWLMKIKKVTKYEDLNEIYEISSKLGAGKFGLVKKCTLKSNKREAAIKIISKSNLKLEELQLARTEIEILKMCQHSNIIKLYDILENHNYIYISNTTILITILTSFS